MAAESPASPAPTIATLRGFSGLGWFLKNSLSALASWKVSRSSKSGLGKSPPDVKLGAAAARALASLCPLALDGSALLAAAEDALLAGNPTTLFPFVLVAMLGPRCVVFGRSARSSALLRGWCLDLFFSLSALYKVCTKFSM